MTQVTVLDNATAVILALTNFGGRQCDRPSPGIGPRKRTRKPGAGHSRVTLFQPSANRRRDRLPSRIGFDTVPVSIG
jgi:hypothetical protein